MNWPELHRTLVDLVTAIEPAGGEGLRIDSAELRVPLEATTRTGPDGLTFFARVPQSQWQSGFQPVVHQGHLVIGPVTDEEGADER
ncbi:hypothetical protein [Streptomyces sp. HUAS ZL42]|uniref:hypothetical protein n=1 Tax=Streptomyces sp. HUAS ZL42 TaxID=3231715 RepID=UPI00345E143A